MSGYLHDGIAKAASDGDAAALIEIDTPGGDLTATHEIVQTLLTAPLPVIVWVGPAGARAASAGTFITLAANVAMMADGARHRRRDAHRQQRRRHRRHAGREDPPGHGGDAALDQRRARTATTTSRLTTVTESKAYTADEAVAAGSIDGLAATPETAVALANGRTVTVNGQSVDARPR